MSLAETTKRARSTPLGMIVTESAGTARVGDDRSAAGIAVGHRRVNPAVYPSAEPSIARGHPVAETDLETGHARHARQLCHDRSEVKAVGKKRMDQINPLPPQETCQAARNAGAIDEGRQRWRTPRRITGQSFGSRNRVCSSVPSSRHSSGATRERSNRWMSNSICNSMPAGNSRSIIKANAQRPPGALVGASTRGLRELCQPSS